jgi:hypothetical protein
MDMNFKNDIPKDLAIRAFSGTSWSPEKRGEMFIEAYAEELSRDWESLQKDAATPEKKELLEGLFTEYRVKYSEAYKEWLTARSRCTSTFIAGPSNFNVSRAEKSNRIEHKRLEKVIEVRKVILNSIRYTLHPEWRPVMAGDKDAVDRLKEKIEKAEKLLEMAKKVNQAIRKNAKAGPDAQVAALVALGVSEERAKEWIKPDLVGRLGVPGYFLRNNNSEVRRLKARLATIEKNKVTETVKAEGQNAKFEDCPADNRVRLFFPGKPTDEIRAKLKKNGFRWTPSLDCWQAYRNPWSIQTARQVAGLTDDRAQS